MNECPKKRRGRVDDQVWSAWGNMPMGLGNEVIRRCISDACGRDGGNVSAFAGEVPKRNPRARGPRRPKGSIAKGSSVIFRCRRSPIIASPLICVPVAGSRLLPRHNFLFSKIWRCESALADKIRRTSGESRSKEFIQE